HLTRRRADQPRNLVADAVRQRDPAGAVPTANEPEAPLVLDDMPHALHHCLRQDAERVAIEIDAPLLVETLQRKPLAHWPQRVRRIPSEALFTRDRHRYRSRSPSPASQRSQHRANW